MIRSSRARSKSIGLLIIVALLVSAAAVSAGTLQGSVYDKSDNTKLLGATITIRSILPGGWVGGGRTDDEGNYRISDIPAGTYDVIYSFIGFTNVQRSSVSIEDNTELTIDMSMLPTAINLNAISVSASRAPEKVLEAPASVSVVSSETVEQRTTLNPTEHVKDLPAVDAVSTGLNQSNVVVRGFNNIFSGSLLVLEDNRIARVPSLRFNAYNFIPTVNEDIERIEVVSGPGSALYGPNSASGVMHIITKSPFTSQGTSISQGVGERNLYIASFRHAGVVNNRIGYKFSGQYYRGLDWSYAPDTLEPKTIQFFRPTAEGPIYEGEPFPNKRDRDIEKYSGEARFDFHFNDETSLIVNGGINRASSIELTGLGAGQAIDWTYSFAQARVNYKDLWVQGFVNASDAGDTYLLRTGSFIIDKSKVYGAQVQHHYHFEDGLKLTYGGDAIWTRPNTEGTINGRNEDDDNINEYGAYVQAERPITEQIKIVGAARLDDHSRLEDVVFSPRAALVFTPDENQSMRFTYNRAYSTPDNNNLFLDLLQRRDVFGVGEAFGAVLPFQPDIDIRVQGVPETGFHWLMGDDGPAFRSPFAPLDPRNLTDEDFIDFNDPIFTNVMWSLAEGAVQQGFSEQLAQMGLTQPQIVAVITAMDNVTPAQVLGVNNQLKTFDPDSLALLSSTPADIADIERLKPTITETFEIGYKGLLWDRVRFSVDLYRTKKHDFIGPLTVETPNVHLDDSTLFLVLNDSIGAALNDPSHAIDAATLATLDLDNPANGGNNNGTISDELAGIYASNSEGIPFGTATPEEMLDPTAVLVGYRNFGDISFYGADLAVAVQLNSYFHVGGTYSYISKNFFDKEEENQVHDVVLNAPKHKFTINAGFVQPEWGLRGDARLRWVDSFKMFGPFVGSDVDQYEVVDLSTSWNFYGHTTLAITVQNVLDNKHIEFVGGAEIGRLAIARVTQTF